MPRITDIFRYPGKSLPGERLARAVLAPGAVLPGDRRFAVAMGAGENGQGWAKKTAFLNLMRHERLALVDVSFDDTTGVMSVAADGHAPVSGDISKDEGRAAVEAFFTGMFADELDGAPARLCDGTDSETAFTDEADAYVSIINRASVAALEAKVGQPVDPRRFRGNILIDGGDAWAEFDWIGRTVRVGAATLEIVERIERCAATNVNPDTAARDLNLPKALSQGFGHVDMGVFGRVVDGGAIAVGDALEPV